MPVRKRKVDPIPEQFESLEAAGEFWDTHDLTDYWDDFHTVKNLEFRIERRHFLIEVDADLVEPLRMRAQQNGTTSETLANRWIRERLGAKLPAARKQRTKKSRR